MNNNNSNNNNKNTQQHHYGIEFSLFVGELPLDCSDDKLRNLFQSKYKSVRRAQVIRNLDGTSRGFGFIRFEEKADFQAALSEGMKLDNITLRLDTAHRNYKNNNRNRYNSFNSSSSNNSNHHNHHPFNNSDSSLHHRDHSGPHHHLHNHHNQTLASHQQHGSHHPPNQQQHGQNSKLVIPDQTAAGQQQHIQSPNSAGSHGGNAVNSRLVSQMQQASIGGTNLQSGAMNHQSHNQSHSAHHQQHHARTNHNTNSQSQQSQSKANQHHQVSDPRGPKGLGHVLSGDEPSVLTQNKPAHSNPSSAQHQPRTSAQHQPISSAQTSTLSQSQTQQPNHIPHISANIPPVSLAATSTTVTSLPSSDISHHPASGLQSSNHSINAGQHMLGPDMRAYAPNSIMDNPHMMGVPDPSMISPSSVYAHMYPYGPPPTFGYMPPPPQPNPVIPISAVPPAPPNQVSSSGVGHNLAGTTTGSNRYNSPHQQHQQQSHQTQSAHAVDANALNAMTAAGVQAQHQAPFYYYYPSPLYFDQTGATGPANMYHPQSFHPQFFAMPSPAYLPNAHSYPTQHPAQAPLASQSDSSATTLVNQQHQQQPSLPPPVSLPSTQQQVNLRNRDIDAPKE